MYGRFFYPEEKSFAEKSTGGTLELMKRCVRMTSTSSGENGPCLRILP